METVVGEAKVQREVLLPFLPQCITFMSGILLMHRGNCTNITDAKKQYVKEFDSYDLMTRVAQKVPSLSAIQTDILDDLI